MYNIILEMKKKIVKNENFVHVQSCVLVVSVHGSISVLYLCGDLERPVWPDVVTFNPEELWEVEGAFSCCSSLAAHVRIRSLSSLPGNSTTSRQDTCFNER